MQVLLKRNWFTPIGRFKKAATKKGPPVEIPDSLRGRLPSDAVIVGEDHVSEPQDADSTMTVAEAAMSQGLDPERASKEAEMAVYQDVSGQVRKSTVEQVRANAVKFQKELDAENATQPMSKAAQKRADQATEVEAHKAKGR